MAARNPLTLAHAPAQADLFPAPPPGADGVHVGYVVVDMDWCRNRLSGTGEHDLGSQPVKDHIARIGATLSSYGPLQNGDTVVIDTQGNVIDGRCRLKGIIESGREAVILLVDGVQPSAALVTDVRLCRVRAGALDGYVPPVAHLPGTPARDFLARMLVEGPAACIVSLSPWLVRELCPELADARWTPAENAHIDRLAHDLAADLVPFAGQSVKVSRTGRILDGRKRMAAVLRSGKAMTVVLVRGVHDGFAGTYDTGRKQFMGHKLCAHGAKQGYAVNGALNLLEGILTGDPHAQPTQGRACQLYIEHARIEDGMRRARKCRDLRLLPPSVALTLLMLFRDRDAAKGDAFFAELTAEPDAVRGGGLFPKLRRALKAESLTSQDPSVRLRQVRATVLTWNAYVEGRTRTRLVPGAAFPRILG